MIDATVKQELEALGVAKVEASFQGGNDEGGYDGVTFYDAAGTELGGEPFASFDIYGSIPPGLTATERALEGILDGEYGGFAGDFYVSGTVTLDVATGKATLAGDERQRSYDSFDREV